MRYNTFGSDIIRHIVKVNVFFTCPQHGIKASCKIDLDLWFFRILFRGKFQGRLYFSTIKKQKMCLITSC